jgi:hypothetical protein
MSDGEYAMRAERHALHSASTRASFNLRGIRREVGSSPISSLAHFCRRTMSRCLLNCTFSK